MEIRGAGGKAAQDRSLDLANMVESAIDQGLAEIGRGLAVASRQTCGQIRFAHRDGRQVAHIQASQIGRRVGRVGVTGSDVQRCREGMIANIWRIVAGAASSLKGGNAAGNQAADRQIVVYAGYPRDVDGPGTENGLPARNRCPRIRRRQRCPSVKGVEDRGVKLAIAGRYKPSWRLERRAQEMDTGVDADKERLSGE